MQVADFLETEPAELCTTHSACHVVAAAIIHLQNEHLTARTCLQIIAVLQTQGRGMEGGLVGGALGPGLVACLVGMPGRLAVVAEVAATALPATPQLGTRGAATGYHREPAVWCRAPSGVRLHRQHPPHHEVLVLLEQSLVIED